MTTMTGDEETDPLYRGEGLKVYENYQIRVPDAVPEPIRNAGNLLDVLIEGPGYSIPITDALVTANQRVGVPSRKAKNYPIEQGDNVALVIDEVSMYAE